MITTSVTTFSYNIYFQFWLITVSYFIILFQPIKNRRLNNCVLLNLSCQYNNIYVNSYKYLKKIKRAQPDDWKKKKEKKKERANEVISGTH